MKVWIIESGEYEQRHVFGVAVSLERAIQLIKDEHPPPYIVKWDDFEPWPEGPERGFLVGHFTAVPGYATGHTAEYDIQPFEVAE